MQVPWRGDAGLTLLAPLQHPIHPSRPPRSPPVTMADVIGILGFALHAAHKVYNVIESIKDAPGEIQALRDHAFQVHGLLKKILDVEDERGRGVHLRLYSNKDPQLDELVKKAQGITATADAFIGKTTAQKDDGTYVVKKIKWPIYAGDAKKLSKRFKSFYVLLTAVYTVSSSVTVDAISSDLRTQQATLTQLVSAVCAMSETLHGAAREQHEGRSMRFDEICAAQTRPPKIAFPRAETQAGPPATTSPNLPSIRIAGPTESDGNSYRIGSLRGLGSNGAFQECDTTVVSPASISETTDSSPAARSCPDECTCTCHRSSSDISPIPSWLNPWIGRLNIPRSVVASLAPSLFPCNDVHCRRSRNKAHTVRYYLPVWFAQVEATIRFESLPVNFCIQTPRVVASLRYLDFVSFHEFRIKLSTRELTLQDVEPDGYSVLHRLLWREQEHGDAFVLIRYALDAGIIKDWQYRNMTAVEFTAYETQRYPSYLKGVQSLDLTIVKPLLHDSIDEASRTLNEKLKHSDLVTFLLQPRHDVTQAVDNFRSILMLPTISSQIHRSDATGWWPLDHAARTFPEAVEVLLQAGASTKFGSYLLHQYAPDQWKAVSALIRAGYPVDERHRKDLGRSPLHIVAANRQPSYRRALELVRHGGHLLDWNARNDEGATPFELADYFAWMNPENEQRRLVRELYRTQCIPFHAQYISSFDGERLMDAEEVANFPRISLIDTALLGDAASTGTLILAGAMVNERDEEGRTLLHHLAMPIPFPKREEVLLEFLRHSGRRAIDWDARGPTNQTAIELAAETLSMENLLEGVRAEVDVVHMVLQYRGCMVLPAGMSYIFPCMDPRYCFRCCSLPCTCLENDVPGMPGSFS